jgi:hypothetical protein
MKLPKLTAKRRLWLYGIAGSGLAAAAVAKWIDPTVVPAWLLFAGAVLGVGGNATAAVKLAQQRKDGTLTDEPHDAP